MGRVGVERWLWLLDRPYIALSVQRLHRKGNWKISARVLRYFFHWYIVLVIEWCECIKYVHFFYFPHRHDDVSWRWVFIPVLDWVDVFCALKLRILWCHFRTCHDFFLLRWSYGVKKLQWPCSNSIHRRWMVVEHNKLPYWVVEWCLNRWSIVAFVLYNARVILFNYINIILVIYY